MVGAFVVGEVTLFGCEADGWVGGGRSDGGGSIEIGHGERLACLNLGSFGRFLCLWGSARPLTLKAHQG